MKEKTRGRAERSVGGAPGDGRDEQGVGSPETWWSPGARGGRVLKDASAARLSGWRTEASRRPDGVLGMSQGVPLQTVPLTVVQ